MGCTRSVCGASVIVQMDCMTLYAFENAHIFLTLKHVCGLDGGGGNEIVEV